MARYRCSVVIPAKNAMPGLTQVLESVLTQETPWPFEVIVIDSGSRDGTVEHVASLEGVRLIEIAPESFGHGRTRNMGVAAADAQYVAFLTHDALPADQHWLANLVAAAEQDSGIAGVFGRHIAYETASPFTRNDLDRHFEGFLAHPLVVHRDLDPQKYENDTGWRQFLHFYSDNNSLLRKSVWEKIPYPDVEFAEDQLWARAVIEAGYAKAYAPGATVYHSHDYSPLEQLRRAFDESRNFKKYFGYELGGTFLSFLKSLVEMPAQPFFQQLDQTRFGKVTVRHRLIRSGQRAGLVTGHFLGARHQLLPAGVSRVLSLDHKLYKA